MEQIELSVAPRTIKGKEVSGLRRSGIVPAVLYGRRAEPVSLQANGRELMRVLMKAGSSHLVKLNIEGAVGPRMALVREVQREPIRGTLLHVDFYGVSMSEKITVAIRVRFEGVSSAAALNEG
ncbi:MAG TPA: 50S ribosomal protein L25, partial [Anaerolineae bacterium]|nr:50S ribosomal protein L25 [Anaerolineae bacterium]